MSRFKLRHDQPESRMNDSICHVDDRVFDTHQFKHLLAGSDLPELLSPDPIQDAVQPCDVN
tara:strand:+ start:26160 stop:26342 length:183 start_codon:yes stop_codon:yes gene_type:complete